NGPWAAPCGPPAAAPAGTSTSGAATRPSGPAPPGASAARPPASTPPPTAPSGRLRSARSRSWPQTSRVSPSERVVVVVVLAVEVRPSLAGRILPRVSRRLGRSVGPVLAGGGLVGHQPVGVAGSCRSCLRNGKDQQAANERRGQCPFHHFPPLDPVGSPRLEG